MPENSVRQPSWVITRHARKRAQERGFTRHDVLAVIDQPELTYPQNTYGPFREIRVRGPIAVVLAGNHVITVLHHRWEEVA